MGRTSFSRPSAPGGTLADEHREPNLLEGFENGLTSATVQIFLALSLAPSLLLIFQPLGQCLRCHGPRDTRPAAYRPYPAAFLLRKSKRAEFLRAFPDRFQLGIPFSSDL